MPNVIGGRTTVGRGGHRERLHSPGFGTRRNGRAICLPVVGVSWYEAYAYTQWLEERWGAASASFNSAGLLDGNFIPLEFHLPTEPEWEKAARGTDGRIYPWGDGFNRALLNIKETLFEHTTPVGQFSPTGDSPYGCADMAGNVWEWCLTAIGSTDNLRFGTMPVGLVTMDNIVDGALARVVRGGSWYMNSRLPE